MRWMRDTPSFPGSCLPSFLSSCLGIPTRGFAADRAEAAREAANAEHGNR